MKDTQRYSDNATVSDTNSQASDQASREDAKKTEECLAPAAAIPIDALPALMAPMQTTKMTDTATQF